MASLLIEYPRHPSLRSLLGHYEKLEDFQNLSLAIGRGKEVDEKLLKKYKIKIDGPIYNDLQKFNFWEFGKKHLFTEEENYLYELNKRGISYPIYRYLEVVFRQAMMCYDAFEYQNENKIKKISSKSISPEERIKIFNAHIDSTKTQCTYGLGTILLEKFQLIERVEKEFAEQIALIEDMVSCCNDSHKETKGISSNFSLPAKLDQIKDELSEWAEREIRIDKLPLRDFITIDNKSKKINFDRKKFVYFSIYVVVAKSIYEPLLVHFTKGQEKTSGIFGFISSKLNYELNGQIQEKIDSAFTSKRFSNSKYFQEWGEIASENNLIDDDFYKHLASLQNNKLIMPFEFKPEINRLKDIFKTFPS